MSNRKRNVRAAAMHQFMAADYSDMARELEALGHKDVAYVLRRRARHHLALAGGQE